MKRLLYFAFLLSGIGYAYETYFFRVKIDSVRTKPTVEGEFMDRGRKETFNPFYGTYVLTQPDTNYILVKLTPSGERENDDALEMFRSADANLYQTYLLQDETGLSLSKDNSRLFPVDRDWSIVRISCPTAETENK